MKDVHKTDYPENYRYYCVGYLGQILASNYRRALARAITQWPAGVYDIKTS